MKRRVMICSEVFTQALPLLPRVRMASEKNGKENEKWKLV
jgi:hypothetical protein